MRRKSLTLFVALFVCLPFVTNAQLYVDSLGIVQVGDYAHNIYNGEGFIVENGATFAVKTHSKVTIDGCVFQSGAKVKIESGNVEVIGKFTAERGSKVEMTQFIHRF